MGLKFLIQRYLQKRRRKREKLSKNLDFHLFKLIVFEVER